MDKPLGIFRPRVSSIDKHWARDDDFLRCVFLAHDYSIDKELYAQHKEHGLILGRVDVGRNCFIGARAMLLPGTCLGDGVQCCCEGVFP